MRCVGLCGTHFRLVEGQSHRLASAGCNSAGVVHQRGGAPVLRPGHCAYDRNHCAYDRNHHPCRHSNLCGGKVLLKVCIGYFRVCREYFQLCNSHFRLCSQLIGLLRHHCRCGDATAGLLSVSRTDDDGLRDCKSVRCRRFGFALSPATACRSLPSRHITKETTTCGSGLFGVGYIVLLIIPAC